MLGDGRGGGWSWGWGGGWSWGWGGRWSWGWDGGCRMVYQPLLAATRVRELFSESAWTVVLSRWFQLVHPRSHEEWVTALLSLTVLDVRLTEDYKRIMYLSVNASRGLDVQGSWRSNSYSGTLQQQQQQQKQQQHRCNYSYSATLQTNYGTFPIVPQCKQWNSSYSAILQTNYGTIPIVQHCRQTMELYL